MKIINKYSDFLFEKLDITDLETKIKDDYKDTKKDILDIINNTLKESKNDINIIDIEDFITDYISSGKESNLIDTLIDDNDIFNFYLKHQSDIDKLLNELGYLDKSPKSNDVYSLYDVIIDGTKQSILEIITTLKKELFKK